MKKALELLVQRMPDWPEEAQAEALRLLGGIEQTFVSPYRLSDSERMCVTEAMAQAEAGELASEAEIRTLFATYAP